ncbi:hypothetical protein LOTGIDRAFT_53303, partial [Lottia gigantea]
NYRQKLVQLDSELDSDNVKCLKYLCFDVIPASKLEKITQGTDLFELLEQKGFLGNGNYFFLAECLSKIGRRDLSEVALDHNQLITTLFEFVLFRSLWFDISEDLDAEEVCKCLYYYGDVPKSKRGGIKSGIDFLNFLEKKKKIGPDNMDYLLDVLKTIERNDLVQMIQKYTERISGDFIAGPPPKSIGPQSYSMTSPLGNQNKINDLIDALMKSEMYRMDRYPRGMIIIIIIIDFGLKLLMGPFLFIADTLDRTFTELGFQVYVHNDLKAVEMVQILTRYSQEDHELFDCFVCVILSHGTRDYIYGANCEPVPIRTLADPLKNLSCPGLCGKPKLFFIQACQGQDKQHDVVRVDDLDEDAPPNGEVIPNEQDFLIGMATIPGFVSYRSKTSGSWFIIKLCEALQKFAKYWDILHILTYVNSEVGKANADIDGVRYKQSPGPLYTLRKRLLF